MSIIGRLASDVGASLGIAFMPIGAGGMKMPPTPRKAGSGWSNANAKRFARKARNIKRHRASARGKA